MKQQLSKLEPVALRDIWPHEASHFTNWLAEEENLALLSDEIGIRIELLDKEAGVGKFSVDILAQESGSDRKIVIENQLEGTDHDHLGKIITYASGYDAEILIWIVKDVRDEHKQAVNWLNENTNTKVNIFIVKMEVWKIGDSAPAPKFNVMIQPNDWQKATNQAGASNKLSTTQMQYLQFWTAFIAYCEMKKSTLVSRKPSGDNWYILSTGGKTSVANIALTVTKNFDKVGCEIVVENSKELFNWLNEQKQEIERRIEKPLAWSRLDGNKRSKIKLLEGMDTPSDGDAPECWQPHYEWMLATAEKFQRVFAPRIAKFQDGDAD